ncbi:MAG: class I SAM-dependent rRNA methyltransferase [Alphaproteobacteria bacterium]|nr:class I SAM-dependent rRNA methyltransferase [Alphaproteobacteria bacterium]
MSDVHVVKLHPKRDKRVAMGHPWVFSNEIDGDITAIPAGGAVDVLDSKGKFLGRGYGNPHSLIAVRILSRRRKEDVDSVPFFAQRLRDALALREAVYPGRRSLRLVFGEADGLAGLVVDRYDDVLAVQISTLGMEVRKPLLEQALQQVFAPRAAVLRNEARVRQLEGLPQHRDAWFGDVPDEVTFDEGGLTFRLPPLGGQKTGHFFDQFDNKRYAASLCRGRTVLDVYANTGGWALHALQAGATHATTVDSDAANAQLAARNAMANGFAEQLTAVCDEGKKTLQGMVAEGRRFGAVVLDPPAFAKTRKTAGSALRGYREINTLGLMLVQEGGFLFTSSCSFHILEDRFLDEVVQAAREAGRQLQLVRRGGQSADHPVLPGVPETQYLKSFAFRVSLER